MGGKLQFLEVHHDLDRMFLLQKATHNSLSGCDATTMLHLGPWIQYLKSSLLVWCIPPWHVISRWDLETRFKHQNVPRLFQLQHVFVSCTLGPFFVNAYYNKIKALWEGLSEFIFNHGCNCGGIKPLVNVMDKPGHEATSEELDDMASGIGRRSTRVKAPNTRLSGYIVGYNAKWGHTCRQVMNEVNIHTLSPLTVSHSGFL